MRTLAILLGAALALAVACGSQAIAANAGPAGVTRIAILGRDLLGMQEACSTQYGALAHPCRSLELMRATQTGSIVAPSPGAFVLPSVVGVGGFQAVDSTGIAAGSGIPTCLVITAPSGAPASLDVGNCNLRLRVLCCATFGDSLFRDGFEEIGALP